MLLKLDARRFEETAAITGSYTHAVAEYCVWLGSTRFEVVAVMRVEGRAGEKQRARAEALAEALGRVLIEKIRSVLRAGVEAGVYTATVEVEGLLAELQQEAGVDATVRDGKVVLEVHEFGSAGVLVRLLRWLDERTVRA